MKSNLLVAAVAGPVCSVLTAILLDSDRAFASGLVFIGLGTAAIVYACVASSSY